MDNIFAQYRMLIITAFTFFFFHLGWGNPLCVRILHMHNCVCTEEESKENYP